MLPLAWVADRLLAATMKPVAGSTLRAVELAGVRKVKAPSCRATEPAGAAAGAKAGPPNGVPTSDKIVQSDCDPYAGHV